LKQPYSKPKNKKIHMKNSEVTFEAIVIASKNGGLVGIVSEVPGAMSQGENEEELFANLRDAITAIHLSNNAETKVKFKHEMVTGHATRQSFQLAYA
jgi:predicted RNase H-like HicB family nuclease